MTIELLHVPGCHNLDAARRALQECLDQLGLDIRVVEREGNFASPSILIDGIDVMGKMDVSGASCRLDVPTPERIIAALRDHAGSGEWA